MAGSQRDESPCLVMIYKDDEVISRVVCFNSPVNLPRDLHIKQIYPAAFFPLSNLPRLYFHAAGQNESQLTEWRTFVASLLKYDTVAVCNSGRYEFFMTFQAGAEKESIPDSPNVSVAYKMKSSADQCWPEIREDFASLNNRRPLLQPLYKLSRGSHRRHRNIAEDLFQKTQYESRRNDNGSGHKLYARPLSCARIYPSFLETLSRNHASWIFGAIAELVDNSRDANATRLDISIEMQFYKRDGKPIPVLCVEDNGCGMSHSGIIRMLSLGNKRREKENSNVIGRYGVGFKSGCMRLGKDALVLTQSAETRSVALLSRSFNRDKEELEIPVVTYHRQCGSWMDFDPRVHTEAQAQACLKAIKDFSPFNEYVLGSKFAAFGENCTGTQVYVYNMAMWGAEYALEWDDKCTESDQSMNSIIQKRDILIRSRRVRPRPGQNRQEVPLDYSLHAYLEVILREPRMDIYVQGTIVKTHSLARSLNNTRVIKEVLLGKTVELTVGRSRVEAERGNCGMFLYWHGRLIEAYMRVGGMVNSADMGNGVIGVMDVTDIMSNGKNGVFPLINKQGFEDCEAFVVLKKWLGRKADEYWVGNFDSQNFDIRDTGINFRPDDHYDRVQCNNCLKWRILDSNFNGQHDLPVDWFCSMPPFRGSCSFPEQEVEPGRVHGNDASLQPYNPMAAPPTPPPTVEEEDDSSTISVQDSIALDKEQDSEDSTETSVWKGLVYKRRRLCH